MKGKIIEIAEDESGYDAIIVIGITKDILLFKPRSYRKDWKEHHDDYGNFQLEDFRIYDEALNEYKKQKFESENFHLGVVDIKQD